MRSWAAAAGTSWATATSARTTCRGSSRTASWPSRRRPDMPATLADLRYLPAAVAEPTSYLLAEPPPGMPRRNFETQARACEITDARAVQEIDLDRWGFVLVRHASAA